MSKPNNLSKIVLKEKINNLYQYYKKYPHQRVDEIDKINQELEHQEYKIAVVANMSAGKSTFINALFGKNVLPAFNHATTDCATHIYSKPDIEKKAKIFFSDEKETIEILIDLENEIKMYAQKDEDCDNDKYKNVKNIELYYPFYNLQTSSIEDISITFIDTPGPNSNGESYHQKHKDQSNDAIRDANLVLFMFDYGQVDANEFTDRQGLWPRIKTRYNEKNFDVFFLLNKIDDAFDDNFQDIRNSDDAKTKWFMHENKAIEKLEKSILRFGIKQPKIYPISSKYQLLHRDDIPWRSPLGAFKNDFKELFKGENYEEKFIDYVGISKLEKDINNYINTSIKDKILKKLDFSLKSIHDAENEYLNLRIQTFQKPKQEAEENLKKATHFLNNEANFMESEFKEKSHEVQREYIELIKNVIHDNIENELKKNTEEATNRTIKFLQLLLDEHSEKDATDDAKNLPQNLIKDCLGIKNIKINVMHEFEINSIEKSLQNFIKSILNDYKNNYLDMKIDMKNNFNQLSEEICNLFNDYKLKFNNELKDTLEIDNIDFDKESLFIKSSFTEDIKVPDSTIDYKHKPEVWDEGGSFSRRKKISSEKHTILISPVNIKKIFELCIESIKRSFLNKEIKNYEGAILVFVKLYQNKFNDFKETKECEIRQLERDLVNSKQNLKTAQVQYSKLKKIQ